MHIPTLLFLSVLLAACKGEAPKDTGTTDTGPLLEDRDGDGYTSGEDCDDSDPDVHPGAPEACNAIDDDCDGEVDEEAEDAPSWFRDGDGDGFGNPDDSTAACEAPPGFVADDQDCDDSDPGVYPGAPEICNDGVDDDCDGLADDDDPDLDSSTATTWYTDADGDGYGDPDSAVSACLQPSGLIADGSDCDDDDPEINPDATETCNGIDDDCSGSLSWLEEDPDGDGVLACESALWLRDDDLTNDDPLSTGHSGSSEAAGLLADLGITTYTADLDTVSITDELLDDYGLLVLYGRGDDGPLSTDEAAALEAWVADGGGLLYMGFGPCTQACDMINSLPSAFGLSCTDLSPEWWGCYAPTVEHPVTEGVGSFCGAGGELWNATSPAEVLIPIGSYLGVAVVEYGDGRVVAVSDEWFLYNSGTGSYDISAGDNRTLVENAWSWLSDFSY